MELHDIATWVRAQATSVGARLRTLRDLGIYRTDIWLVRRFQWLSRNRSRIVWVAVGLTAVASFFGARSLQVHAGIFFADPPHLEALHTLLVTIGGALVGAAAIAFSILIFATQVNIERMPHALFSRVSTDPLLLLTLLGVVAISMAIAAASMVVDGAHAALAITGSIWGTAAVAWLLWSGYLRAIELVDPRTQLGMVLKDAKREFAWWDKRATRASPLMKTPAERPTTHDWARITYLKINREWSRGLFRNMRHAVTYHRTYAASGDYEISSYALNCLVALLGGYVKIKRKTFFHNPGIINNPEATDGVINEALEHLRQNVRIGVSRADEQQIEQNLGCIAQLVALFLSIDYCDEAANKTHAELAASYLAGAVESVTPHQMPDVIMEGVRLMGRVATVLSQHSADDAVSTIQKLGQLGCVGVAGEDYRPIINEAMQQLAELTLYLLVAEGRRDVRFALNQVRDSVALIAKFFMNTVKDAGLTGTHGHYLAPYFSLTWNHSLLQDLTGYANAVLQQDADRERVERICSNLRTWAEDEPKVAKDLLLLSLAKRSHFTFDITHWIGHLVRVFVAASTAPHCRDHDRRELQRVAISMLWVLSWVPDEDEVMRYVSTYKIDDILFEAGWEAHRRQVHDVAAAARSGLISLAMKCGRHQDPMHQMESALRGAMILAMVEGTEPQAFAELREALQRDDAPAVDARRGAVRELRELSEELGLNHHAFDDIDQATAAQPRDQMRALLERIILTLDPDRPALP